MSDVISTRSRRQPQTDSPWSQLQTDWLQIPLPKGTGRITPTWEVFSERFDRCLRRVSFYVSRRVSDRKTLGRIVTRVIVENLEFFAAECDQPDELRRLRASAERILALEAATSPGAGGPSPRRGHEVYAAPPDENSPR